MSTEDDVGVIGLLVTRGNIPIMVSVVATQVTQVAESYVPIAHLKLVIVDTFNMMSVMLVSTLSA